MFAVRLCDHPVTNVNVVPALDGRRQRQKFGSFLFLAWSVLSRSQCYGPDARALGSQRRGQSAGGADSRTKLRAFPHYAVVARS
jgi:hypothetical protein